MWGIGYEGIGVEMFTLLIAAGIVAADEGKVVCISENDTADLCEAGSDFCGVLHRVESGSRMPAATIQHKGFKTLPYTGNPGLGHQALVANGAGGVMPPAAAAAAFLVMGVEGNNNAIKYTAKDAGEPGNDISVSHVDPVGNNQALSVDVVGRDIIVKLATNGAGAITSTAAQVIAEIAASPAADLVTAVNSGASTGAGAVVAAARADLANGADAGVGRQFLVVKKDADAGMLTINLG